MGSADRAQCEPLTGIRRPTVYHPGLVDRERRVPSGQDSEELQAGPGHDEGARSGSQRTEDVQLKRIELEAVLRRAPRHPALQHVRYAFAMIG